MNNFFESDVLDAEDNIIISPGLKVRHKDSQFEYTVDNAFQDSEGIKVVLRLPEEPRFDPKDADPEVLDSVKPKSAKIMYELDPGAVYIELEDKDDETDTIVVTQDEFEKDYEVR